jgi:hypothetical protein
LKAKNMPRKPMTPEQRAKASERLKAAREAKQVKAEEAKRREEEFENRPKGEPVPANAPNLVDLVEKLAREIEELKAGRGYQNPQEALPKVAQMQGGFDPRAGGVQGIQYKYPVEKSYYPDPTDRLYDDPALKRFAMRENFYFKWDVVGEVYEKANITYSEPRFSVELFRRLFDEEGNPTGKMVLVNRQFQMEDELTARLAADKLGLTNTFATFEDLMNEMRYYRIRRWLLGIFTPPKIEQHNRKATTMVIDGKVVEVYDTEELTDSESGAATAETIKRETAISA